MTETEGFLPVFKCNHMSREKKNQLQPCQKFKTLTLTLMISPLALKKRENIEKLSTHLSSFPIQKAVAWRFNGTNRKRSFWRVMWGPPYPTTEWGPTWHWREIPGSRKVPVVKSKGLVVYVRLAHY